MIMNENVNRLNYSLSTCLFRILFRVLLIPVILLAVSLLQTATIPSFFPCRDKGVLHNPAVCLAASADASSAAGLAAAADSDTAADDDATADAGSAAGLVAAVDTDAATDDDAAADADADADEDASPVEDAEADEGGGQAYSVEGSQYLIYMNDEEGLLDASEEDALLQDMIPITEYGNAAFMTTELGSSDYMEATKDIYHSLFGTESGTIFLIDMNHRKLILVSDGAIYKTVTKSYANTITDNVYKMARKGDYYRCASEAFKEVYTLLQGRKIAQPMRHITNAMLAMILATLILYFTSRHLSKQRAAKDAEILSMLESSFHFSNGKSEFTRRSKVYNPTPKSSGGSGGGGGGFSSGGGGSHGF